jgi:hypothetical protein
MRFEEGLQEKEKISFNEVRDYFRNESFCILRIAPYIIRLKFSTYCRLIPEILIFGVLGSKHRNKSFKRMAGEELKDSACIADNRLGQSC